MPTLITNPQFTVGKSILAENAWDKASASLTFAQGDIFRLSSGQIVQAASAGNNLAATTTLRSMAKYTEPTALAAAADVCTHPLNKGDRVIMSLCNDDAVAAWSESYRGGSYEIRRITITGLYAININANTNTKVKILSCIQNTENDLCALVEAEVL